MPTSASPNGTSIANGLSTGPRAAELETLLEAVLAQLIQFIRSADNEIVAHQSRRSLPRTSLVEYHPPSELASLLSNVLTTSSRPLGQAGLLSALEPILRYSVNTSAPGFLDKLYAAPVPPGIAADLILSVLNTNLHVYQVSPVLTLIEQHVTKSLAALFGLSGPRAGGINVQGGSASNMTSIVIARNTLYPQTKVYGNSHQGLDLVIFASAHGHYSIEKAAQQCGFGSAAVVPVPVDPITGTMIPAELDKLIIRSKEQGKTPFYVSATAGTTVLGSFDPFVEIAAVARRHGLWFHIDGAWGGSFIFSERLKSHRLRGCDLADSIAINPHKMMGVPVTCSFLLGRDLKEFHAANTLRAGYLFHDQDDETAEIHGTNGHTSDKEVDDWIEPNDLADLTLQCGRRGDSLKLFLAWQYYGTDGYRDKVEAAHDVASYMATLVHQHPDLVLVSTNPPPCLQVCFHYAPGGRFLFGQEDGQLRPPLPPSSAANKPTVALDHLGRHNSKVTESITRALVRRGFMIDFAPALEGHEHAGSFFRAVINIHTARETVEKLVDDIIDVGAQVVLDLKNQYKYRDHEADGPETPPVEWFPSCEG